MKPKAIFVLLPMEYAYFAGVAKGAVLFCRGVPGLNVFVRDPVGLAYAIEHKLGPVVTAVSDPSFSNVPAHTAWPVVNVSARSRSSHLPRVLPDNRQAGRLAAEHLLSIGFRNFVFVGYGHWYSELRLAGFADALRARGFEPRVTTQDEFLSELARMPRPTAVFADSDRLARVAMQHCSDAQLHVPEDVAVVGVDNDPILCEAMTPQMTSVDVNAEKVGFEAARLALDLCAGSRLPAGPIFVTPRGVVARESTDIQAVSSPALARAMGIVRQRACEGITVNEIAVAARVPRRTLHRLCIEHFGLSVSEAIRRRRIEQAKLLLAETDRTAADVSACCGFSHYGRFHALFRRIVGVTPGVYRSQRRMK